MSDRQADVRDEGTPVTVPAQKMPTVAPETGGGKTAVAVPRTMEDKPQVRGKGPAGRERAPARARTGKKRAAPAKAKGPARVAKKGVAKKARKSPGKPTGARKGSGQKKPKKAAGKKAVGAKGATRKAGGRSPSQGGRGGTQKAKRRG